jgi:ABC-type multidrug transport system ATPase subunit
MSEDLALAATELSKTFGGAFHLGPATFSVEAGETIAVLGRNGAGKSTLFQLLTGNLDASGGQVRLGGKRLTPDTPELKRRLGYLPQNPVLPRWATGGELLRYAAALHGLEGGAARAKAAEDYWDCGSYRNKPLQTLSYGMLKRVALALATLHDPDCLILDEPFSGLDLFHIKTLEGEIARRTQAGRATLMSTHVAAFCAALCSRVLLVKDGAVTQLQGWERQDSTARVAAIETAFFGQGASA